MEPAQETQEGSLVMPQSTGDRIRVVTLVLGVWALLFAGTHVLGTNPVVAVVLIVACTVRLWWTAFVVLTKPPPALTPEGVRLRNGRSVSVVPWAEVISLGLVRVSRMSRMYLEVLTTNAVKYPGPGRNGLNFIYLSPSVVTPDQVREAVAGLTQGQMTVRDEPDRRTLST